MRPIVIAALFAPLLFGCTEQQTSESGAEATGGSCEAHQDVASCLADEKCGWRTDKGACAANPKADKTE